MYTRANPSPEYTMMLEWAKSFHASHKAFTGRRLLQSYSPISLLLKQYDAKSLLDYGAGKGEQYTIRDFPHPTLGTIASLDAGWGVAITPYDPAWPPYAKLPPAGSLFTGTIATDVLEYIPEEDMDWVIEEMMSFSERFVFAHVSTIMSAKKRPRGMERRNRPVAWWTAAFLRAGAHYPDVDWVVEIRDGKNPGRTFRNSGSYAAAETTEFDSPSGDGFFRNDAHDRVKDNVAVDAQPRNGLLENVPTNPAG